jgi:hypothetical protein
VTHCLVNPIIDVDGDVASASFDYFCLGLVDGVLRLVSGGRFVFHRLVRYRDRWRIDELEFAISVDPTKLGPSDTDLSPGQGPARDD